MSISNIEFVNINCPYSGKSKTLMVERGTKVWNAHKWDGSPTGSFWRGTKEAAVRCGNKSFHVDTNNPSGVLGIINIPGSCKK